ncbi:MAG: hypothetical protein IE878_06135 [Epsilonproteobacteria bacterium]|nr:hypothetical protein [Campylobacterota bacterium]
MDLIFYLKINNNRRLEIDDFTSPVHHRSNTHKQRVESKKRSHMELACKYKTIDAI